MRFKNLGLINTHHWMHYSCRNFAKQKARKNSANLCGVMTQAELLARVKKEITPIIKNASQLLTAPGIVV